MIELTSTGLAVWSSVYCWRSGSDGPNHFPRGVVGSIGDELVVLIGGVQFGVGGERWARGKGLGGCTHIGLKVRLIPQDGVAFLGNMGTGGGVLRLNTL